MDNEKLEKLKQLVESVGGDDYMVVIYGDNENFHFGGCASRKEISETIRAMLFERFDGNEEIEKDNDFFLMGIIDGICDYLENGGRGKLQMASRLVVSASAVLRKKLKEAQESIKEDCSKCPDVDKCELPDAVAFRKRMGGIPLIMDEKSIN